MVLNRVTLETIQSHLPTVIEDPIWEQAEDQGISEYDAVSASEAAVQFMMDAITKVDL